MGPSGSGKTSFANLASGSTLQVASSSASCTDRIQTTREFDVDGCAVTLVDTPGSDYKTEAGTLKSIRTFLADQYQLGGLTTGVIYLHSIRDEESSRDLKAFEEICGDEALRNAAIVTSKWDSDNSKHRRTRDRKERELMAGPFSSFKNKGARIFRNDRGQQSALEIIRYLVQKRPILLQAQWTMVDEGLRLQHTGTGHILLRDLSTDPAQDELDMLRQPISRDYGATQSGGRLQSADVELQKPRRPKGEIYHDEQRKGWDLGEMLVCFCFGAALYAFMASLKQHTWHGVDMIMV